MTAPTTTLETEVRVMFDKFWEEVKFKGFYESFSPELKSQIETLEEGIIIEFDDLLSSSEIREMIEEERDDAYWSGHEDGQKAWECETCSNNEGE
jgi:hypothetical protein